MNTDKINGFLSRIGLADIDTECTLELLSSIQEACVLNIPYENLSILRGESLPTDADALYDKIVTQGRGGYCFELNAFLHAMLAEMGFDTKSCFARFLRGETDIPFRRHRIVIVTLKGEDYMLDIGVGQTAPRFPLKLEENMIQEQNGETYRFKKDSELGWVLWEYHGGEWRRYISFTTEKQYEIDFFPTSFWCEKHPESPFNKAEMIAIKTKNGRKTVNGNEYKIFEGDTCIHCEKMSSERKKEILYSVFGLE